LTWGRVRGEDMVWNEGVERGERERGREGEETRPR
jgi:hypothetical protein